MTVKIEDPDSQRPTEAMAVPHGEPDHPGDATIIDERLGPGTVVGGYEIDDELGRGAMGVVYAATHPVIGRRVAIKVLRQLGDSAAIDRFVLEARAVNEIGHRNIVDIFDFGTLPDGRAYLVMDLLLGETLGARLARGPLAIADAAAITSECASALAAAHAKSIVHRDLKPDNVFLVAVQNSHRPAVKLLDFGLVKLIKPDAGVRTKTGAVVGTADYMSPEQGRGRDVDHRTDLYALGVMLFQMLTGRLPYPRKSFLDALVAHAEEPVPSLLAAVPSAPKQLAQLVEAMMAKDRYKRPNITGIRAVLKKFKGPDSAPLEATAIAALPPVPTLAPPRTVTPPSLLDTLRGPGVGATPPQPIPVVATPDPDESRPTSEFAAPVNRATPVVQIPIGAPAIALEPHDSGPIDPPTLITTPIEPRVTPPEPAAAAVPADAARVSTHPETLAPGGAVPPPAPPPATSFVLSAPGDVTHIAPPVAAAAPPEPVPAPVPVPGRPTPVPVRPSPMPQPQQPQPQPPQQQPPPLEPGPRTAEIRRTPTWIIIVALLAIAAAVATMVVVLAG